MSDEFDRQDYIIEDLEWRWTGVPATVYGLHSSVLLGIPLVFATLFSKWAFLGWMVYVAFVALLKMRHNLSPFEFIRMRLVKLVTGNRWSVR